MERLGTEPDDPTLNVARDLRTIVELSATLRDQAVARASHHDMPGGSAMVMLGPTSSPIDRERRGELIEAQWLKTHGWKWCDEHGTIREQCDHRLNPWADEDTAWATTLWDLRYWSEAWRDQHDVPSIDQPTVETEAAWLGEVVRWAYQHEPHWAAFVKDIATARGRLEALLYAGERDTKAVVHCTCGGELVAHTGDPNPCGCPRHLMHIHDTHGPCTCRRIRAARLEPIGLSKIPDVIYTITTNPDIEHLHARRDRCCLACYWQRRHANHHQGGRSDTWRCVDCGHTYTPDEYRQRVAADARDNATALPAIMLTERFPVSIGQVRMWANRGKIRRHGRDELGRMLYDVADVQQQVEQAATADQTTAM